MYEEAYSEWLVKCKKPFFVPILKVLVIVLMPFAILSMLFFWFGFLIVLALAAAYFGLNCLGQKEYEYTYVAGELTFDRILGAQFRKRRMTLSMDDIEQIASWDSHELTGLRNRPGIKITDFASGNADAKCYGIVCRKGGETNLVKFEPGERMLQDIKKSAPRKVII